MGPSLLVREGFPVPAGVVIPVEIYQRYLSSTGTER